MLKCPSAAGIMLNDSRRLQNASKSWVDFWIPEDCSGVDERRQTPPYQRVSIRSRAPSASYENR